MKHTILSTFFVFILVLSAATAYASLDLTGEQFIIVGESAPTSDVLTGVTIGQFLKGLGMDLPVGSALMDADAVLAFSESDLDDRVFYVIDGKEITILVGTDARSEFEDAVLLLKDFMEDEGFSVTINYNPSREDLLVTGELPDEDDENKNENNEENNPVACTMDVRACPDGTFVGRIAPDCEFEKCPEYAPVDPLEKPEDAHADTCEGCKLEEKCISYGDVLEGQRYCATDGVISAQKEDGSSCKEQYECKNECHKESCFHIEPKKKVGEYSIQ